MGSDSFTKYGFSLYIEKMSFREKDILDAFLAALPSEAVQVATIDASADVVLKLPDGSTQAIDFKWAGHGFPRDVVRIAPENQSPNELAQAIVVAEHISQGSRDLLQQKGLSWFALDGAASLHIGTIWVARDGQRDRSRRPATFDSWTPASADVAEALLATISSGDDERVAPGVEALSEMADRSVGAVSKALTAFDSKGWTSKRSPHSASSRPGTGGGRRVVTDATALLTSWAEYSAVHVDRWTAFHFLDRDVTRLARRLTSQFGEDVVYTGLFASELIAPTLTAQPRIRCYLPSALGRNGVSKAMSEIGATPAASGRVLVASGLPATMNTARRETADFATAAPIRVYADLALENSARASQAAEDFRTSVIGF